MLKKLLEKIQRLRKSKHTVSLAMLLIIMLGTGLRLYHLGANPFLADEFLDLNAAYGYQQTGSWQAWDFNTGSVNTTDVFAPRDERAWLYKWQVAKVFEILPATEATARLVSVGWGIVSIILIFFISRSFTGSLPVALISAFLFAVSVSGIEFDRKLRMYAMFFPVYLALSWSLFKFLESKFSGSSRFLKKLSDRIGLNPFFLMPVMLLGALALHLQLLTANIAPVIFAYLAAFVIIHVFQKRSSLDKYAVFLLLGTALGMLGWFLLPQILGVFFASIKFFINNGDYLWKVFGDYRHPLLAAILSVLGVWWLWKAAKKPKEALWLGLSFLVPVLMAAFLWKRPQGGQYIFFVQSFLIILIACGTLAIAEFLRENLKEHAQKAFGATIIVLLLLLPDYGYFFSGSGTTYRRDNTDIGDYRKVFTYVRKHVAPDSVIVTRNFRTFYLKDAGLPVFDFGGERADHDVRLSEIQELMKKYPNGWVVLFDNDDQFISKDALVFIKENLQATDTSAIRGAAKAYTWGNVR